MLNVAFHKNGNSVLRILCLGAHCDDIEIGCGGTVLRLLDTYEKAEVLWVVFSSTQQRASEANKCARVFLQRARKKKVIIKNYRDGFFPYVGGRIKDYFESLKPMISPDLVFTHYRHDLHQDHRVISDLTWNTFRKHLILEYEIPKFDGDLGSPNFFVPLDESVCRQKIENILGSFKSQNEKQWFTEETFRAILRLRAIESGAGCPYAEAFFCRKVVL